MPDVVRELTKQIAELARRLRNLETAPRATQTSVRGGFTRWQTDDVTRENPKLYAGRAAVDGSDVALTLQPDDADTAAGGVFIGTNGGDPDVAFGNDDASGYAFRVFDGEMLSPAGASAWQRHPQFAMDANGRSTTSSGSYGAGQWYAAFTLGTHAVYSSIDVIVGAGVTSCAVKLTAEAVSTRTGYAANGQQTVVEQTGITTSSSFAGPWTVPDTLWTPDASPVGTLVLFRLMARVEAGAGNVDIAPILPLRQN